MLPSPANGARRATHRVVAVIGARARAAVCAAATAAVHRSYGAAAATSQAPVREACFLGFPLDFYFRGTKYVQHFEGLYLRTSQSIALACSYIFFFIQYAHAFFSSFWPCLSSASSSKAQWVNIISEDF